MKRNRKPQGYRPILSIDTNAKTVKGQKFGYLTGILYFLPAFLSKVMNLCPKATAGCMFSCLNTAGRGSFTSVQKARLAKTLFYAYFRELFLECLRYDIRRLERRAAKLNLTPVCRINGTSDLPKLARMIAAEFPNVTFYDYTKIDRPWERILPNYHLTFSRSESNESECLDALAHGINVAVVFDTKRGKALPETWHGYTVIDGDISDLRFLDPAGVVVGLRAKGKAKKDTLGFVVRLKIALAMAA